MIKELDMIILREEVPAAGLVRGDVGTVVLVHGGGEAYEVEFVALNGQTVGVVTLEAGQVRAVTAGEIANARRVRAGP